MAITVTVTGAGTRTKTVAVKESPPPPPPPPPPLLWTATPRQKKCEADRFAGCNRDGFGDVLDGDDGTGRQAVAVVSVDFVAGAERARVLKVALPT